MPDLTIWVSGADVIEIRSLLASEGADCPQTFLAEAGVKSATSAANKT